MASRQTNSITGPPFLFDSPGFTTPGTSRRVHIRRLVDVLQVSVHRHDWRRAQRAWCILARCKEFEWKTMWKTGLLLAISVDSTMDMSAAATGHPQRLEYLRVMMLRSPEYRVHILQEIILHFIISNRHQDALDELELYLPSFPYQDNPVLHIYAGLLCLFLAQASGNLPLLDNLDGNHHSAPHSVNQGSVRECKSHFRRALDLDPENPVASGFLSKLANSSAEDSDAGNETDHPVDPESRPHNMVGNRPQKKRREKG